MKFNDNDTCGRFVYALKAKLDFCDFSKAPQSLKCAQIAGESGYGVRASVADCSTVMKMLKQRGFAGTSISNSNIAPFFVKCKHRAPFFQILNIAPLFFTWLASKTWIGDVISEPSTLDGGAKTRPES